MQITPQQLWIGVAVALLSTAIGCGSPAPKDSPAGNDTTRSETPDTSSESKPLKGKSQALKAKEALFEKLSGRLVATMSSGGPAAAIQVCSQEAPQLAAEVGKEYGVSIGRTSFKLRNPLNQPPAWAESLIEERVDTPQFLELENGATAALLPIRLQPQCLVCHGPTEQISPAVQESLAALYPADAATGFEAGDLRGWFWVEVPQATSDE